MTRPDLESYYRRHARFYDATRWAFRFGRNDLLRRVRNRSAPRRVLEVGCGTGTNLRKLAGSYPNAIAAAASRLAAGGCLAVVDFHDSPFASFNRFMELNHVRLGGHLLEELQRVVNKSDHRVSRAFLGIWRFFTFLS